MQRSCSDGLDSTGLPQLIAGPEATGDCRLSPFAGKVALVTGGNKGIGRGIALRLAALGADVGITYFRHGDAANATVAELETAGVRAIARKSFFSEPGSGEPARTMEWISSELGPPAFLVSNAGTGVQRALVETKRIHWDWAVETHAVTFLEMVRDGPELEAVVAVSSLGATRVLPIGYGLLAAAKAALESLVRYLAIELAPRCRVNAITPGLVDTDAARQFDHSAELIEAARAQMPAGRLVTPADVGAAVAFFLSPAAAMITGQTIVVDGGYSMLL